jgi:adenylyltransferase/sulfurtransferase
MVVKMENMDLDQVELDQYARQMALPGWGAAGQKKLKNASVLIVGLGGLGSVSSLYLAAAGVGRIGLVDEDLVSLSNLPRQILYTTKDIGSSKVALAEKRLLEHNPSIQIKSYPTRLTIENAVKIFETFDLVIDGTDNFPARSVINEICINLEKPYIYGAVNGFDGQVSVFDARHGPCLRCLFPDLPSSNRDRIEDHSAVLNTVPAMVGTLQATQAIKLIVGVGEPLLGRLVIFNALEPSFKVFEIHKKPCCQVCGRPGEQRT